MDARRFVDLLFTNLGRVAIALFVVQGAVNVYTLHLPMNSSSLILLEEQQEACRE